MKRLNFNIKDRKVLTIGLCLILVCVFTLTVAYAALSAVLTIQGSARVTAADWDIYLDNPRVTSGSATTDVPIIKTSSTLEFETILNMPGDFYEFTVDVVNNGSIDAMIENVVKTPELTEEQAKYLNYEITYQNGETIENKQLLAKETTMPIKVRIEYRRDISNNDLPTGQTVLNLALTLEYTQSDGSGSSVEDNGAIVPTAYGYLDVGYDLSIGDEDFHIIGVNDDNVKLLAVSNLDVGDVVSGIDVNTFGFIVNPISNPTGLQNEFAIGGSFDDENNLINFPWIGVVPFSNDEYHGNNYSDYSGSLVEKYVNDYKNIIESIGVEVLEARLITKDELVNDFGCVESTQSCRNSDYSWIYSSSYWTSTANDGTRVWVVVSDGKFTYDEYQLGVCVGVRPVLVIPRDSVKIAIK